MKSMYIRMYAVCMHGMLGNKQMLPLYAIRNIHFNMANTNNIVCQSFVIVLHTHVYFNVHIEEHIMVRIHDTSLVE